MAPPTQQASISTVIGTCLALIDQFLSSLDAVSQHTTQTQPASYSSPLSLLKASSAPLKSTTTKISLLTITAPFTPAAVSSTVQPLNVSILPSLVTATLLITPQFYPQAFVNECRALTRAVLKDLKALLLLVKHRSEDGSPKSELEDADKKNVTEVTGKIWEDCDLLAQFADEDIPGFVARKAKQWLELMKDAVKEFEDWDPEEEVDDEDWLGLNEAGSDEDEEPATTKTVDQDRATISAGVKEQALKVLSRIPQSVHVVIKQRLEKLPREAQTSIDEPAKTMPKEQKKTLDIVLSKTRLISECIDESAEAMYMGNLELCLRKAGEARALTIEVVEAVLQPWSTKPDSSPTSESKEDQYIKRALTWIQQVEAGSTAKDANRGSKT